MELTQNKNHRYQILTDSGWSDFDGVMIKGIQETIEIELEDGSTIITTHSHKMYTEAMEAVETQHLTVNHNIITRQGTSRVKKLTPAGPTIVYDIHNVHNNNRFFANDMLVSNCEFVIYDETLINSMHLTQMKGIDPAFRMGQVRWYKQPSPAYMYAIALDPSKGTGGDSSAIQVLELPTMVQVAEWQHNKTPVEGQIKCVMDIMQFLRDHGVHQVYWTVENNGLGEAAMVVIRDTGEENFPGEFLNEPSKAGAKRRTKGFHTSATSKIESALMFKRLVESGKLKLNSKPLVSELKNFVARGHSYSAKPGEHDDLVTSMMMIIRMVNYISTFEDEVYSQVNSNLGLMNMRDDEDDNDYSSPMPMSWL